MASVSSLASRLSSLSGTRAPLKRIIDPAEVAALVKFLCSPEAGAITGQTYNICGGQVMS